MKVTMRMDRERARKLLTLDDLSGMQAGNSETMKKIIACFMIDPKTDDYYPVNVVETDDEYIVNPDPVAARKMGMLTLEKLADLAGEFNTSLDAALVPPPTGG